MDEENLNQEKLAADKEHKETLGTIINTLREEHHRGNLEELLVYYALESEPTIKRFYTIRTGHTLHQIMELVDEFAQERRNQQN